MKNENDLIKMNLEGVRMEFPSQKPIILLKEETGNRFLPIWIGAFEAYAIALELAHYKTPRPMTHDLIIDILNSLNVKVDYVCISDIIDNTFYAILTLVRDKQQKINIDIRPSDAIAIAVRSKCPVFASVEVIENAGLTITTIDEEVEKFRDFLDHTNPDDFGIK
ncbi:MAG: bifunctional nuclease family protein [Actinomycetota bacterium]|nr:bifunctional nuclease family protein [Actinomycetota bacterium]